MKYALINIISVYLRRQPLFNTAKKWILNWMESDQILSDRIAFAIFVKNLTHADYFRQGKANASVTHSKTRSLC